MSVQLAIANIALDTASVSRQGFGELIFVGKHNYFQERVRTYTSTKAMVDDGIPTTANIYIAAQKAFSQTPSPKSIKIGRQETTSVLTPTGAGAGLDTSITIAAKDAVTATFTTSVDTDEEAIVDALKALIDADTDIAAVVTTTKVGTGADAVLELSQTVSGTDWFVISDLANLTEAAKAVSTETAAATIAAIQEEDDAWYYFHAEDKSNTFILAAAADLEAKLKVYRTSVSEVGSYAATPTGTAADLSANNYFRTQCFYHHDAETAFPEVASTAEIVFATTGTVTYVNRPLAAVEQSLNANGFPLTATQQINLKKVNCDFFTTVAGGTSVIAVVGKVAAGEWIDNIVGRDNMQVDIEADFTNLFIRQKASKVSFNNKGAATLRATLGQTLVKYTASPKGIHNFIEDDFTITIPDQSEFLADNKATRTFTQITFTATLTNAIHMVEITGTLSI